ncbi:MAG TPA: hypothetical protein VFK10_21220 [Burkholderiaceae bacterium]|nr:hypothetical protein [Burkholderiaceae bacterium]
MQDPATYTEAFDREHGFTPEQWLDGLRGAVAAAALDIEVNAGRACVHIGAGMLELQWTALPPRRIALVQLPRLAVSYRFRGVAHAQRAAFMRHFDLVMLRGGG